MLRCDQLTSPGDLLALAAGFQAEAALAFVAALCTEELSGRQVGTPGHDRARDLIVAELRGRGLPTTVHPVEVSQVPLLDATPILEIVEPSSRRVFTHRVDFAAHPRTACTPSPVTGTAVRSTRPAPGTWLILDEVPQGPALAELATEVHTVGGAGLLTAQYPDASGFLTKRMLGGPVVAVPVVAARPAVLTQLAGQVMRASAPLHRDTVQGANVVATVPGAPQAAAGPLLVTAHYDGVGADPDRHFPAAGDNASGVGVLAEVARVVATAGSALRRSVHFAAVDAEEVGGQGSRRHAEALRAAGSRPLVLNLDMAGKFNGAVCVELGTGSEPLRDALHAAGRALRIPLVVGPVASDNRSYAGAGFPAAGIGLGATHYHSPLDSVDQVDTSALDKAGRLILGVIWQLAFTPAGMDIGKGNTA
ncbi:MAG: M28 family metallopeptidase [Pseudonocardiaceae bacterium]